MPARGGAYETYSVFNFDKGLDVKTSPLKRAASIRQDTLNTADNWVMSTAGAVTSRVGTQPAITASAGTATVSHLLTEGLGDWTTGQDTRFLPTLGLLGISGVTGVVTGGTEFIKSDGTHLVVFGADDGTLYTLNAGAVTQISSGHTTGTRWYFATYNDTLLIANRADAPMKTTDGVTVSALGGSPPMAGGPMVVHGNRIFWLDGVNTSRLTWSALDNAEDYTTPNNAGNVAVSQNDGSALVALVPSINELVLLKGRRPYRLQGTSPSTFTLTNVVPTTGSVGAVSTQGALFALNDVWYLATSGIVRLTAVQAFGDLRESFPSTPIQPYFETGTGFTISLANLDKSVLAYDPQHNRIYVAVDHNGDGQNDLLLVYDGATKGWTTWPGFAAASLWQVKNTTTGEIDLYGGGYDGQVFIMDRENASAEILSEARHLSALGVPGVEKSVRHAFLYLKEEGPSTVRVDTKFDFGAGGGQSFEVSQQGSSHLLGVNWVLGVDPLGRQDQIIKRINVHGTGEFLEIGVRNTGPGTRFTWYGYEAIFRQRRVIRRGFGG